MPSIRTVTEAASAIVLFPDEIDDDGVDGAALVVTPASADGGLGTFLATEITFSGDTGLTITANSASSNGDGSLSFTITSVAPATYTDVNVLANGALIGTFTLVVGDGYAAPNVLNNLSFETTWDSYIDGGVGDPVAGSPHTIARSTEQAYAGTTSVKFGWEANATDKGAAFFRSLGGSYDELWVRLYFYLVDPWSITSVQKWTRFRTASTQVGGWYLSDSKGLAWGFDLEASAVTASVIPKASIPLGQWNQLECHYRRNGDAEPNVGFWLNGAAVAKADGADASGYGLTWLGGRLYAGARNNSTQINMIQHVGTLNGGNTGSGTVYLDYIGVSTAGRIGP